ncbi:hypothetical protein BAU15_08925 [Enterococcus sp. JM4C]|uniref:ROK family protein n=1 Tax=Candidatus Enterococcus huntleyi TaxID=1857217 RepID=UPI00137B78CF|nr:ROK family protein [Enterococcus sp. JM4C]KAF1296758.1 hypothetical protein BAU15_08925 [Enterococcus sp. JM4C]
MELGKSKQLNGGNNMVCLTIDLGATHLKTAIYTQFTKQLIEKEQFDSPKTWDKMRRLIDACIITYMGSYEISALSFSLPGGINESTKQIEEADSLPYLNGVAFQNYFEGKYTMPVFVENQAICAGAAETTLGMKDEQVNALYLKIETVVTGAIFNEGKNYRGMHKRAGSFGKMLMDGGKDFSQLASLTRLAEVYSGNSEQKISPQEILKLAREGDKKAKNLFEELFRSIATAIYTLQVSFDPEWLILSFGETLTHDPMILEEINRELVVIVNKKGGIIPQIRWATFPEDAALLGAGEAAMSKSREQSIHKISDSHTA